MTPSSVQAFAFGAAIAFALGVFVFELLASAAAFAIQAPEPKSHCMPFGARPLGRVMTPSSVQALAFGAAFAFVVVVVVVFFGFAAAEAAALGCLAAAALGFGSAADALCRFVPDAFSLTARPPRCPTAFALLRFFGVTFVGCAPDGCATSVMRSSSMLFSKDAAVLDVALYSTSADCGLRRRIVAPHCFPPNSTVTWDPVGRSRMLPVTLDVVIRERDIPSR
jgi:hypothetical protein